MQAIALSHLNWATDTVVPSLVKLADRDNALNDRQTMTTTTTTTATRCGDRYARSWRQGTAPRLRFWCRH
jgi:hypothetical protein